MSLTQAPACAAQTLLGQGSPSKAHKYVPHTAQIFPQQKRAGQWSCPSTRYITCCLQASLGSQVPLSKWHAFGHFSLSLPRSKVPPESCTP